MQILLVLAIILVVPRSSPLHYDSPHTLTELRHKGPEPSIRYAVVFDAGSTGSRIHVFKFEQSASKELKLISDTFEQLKPGLSSYADAPEKAAQSLQPLVEVALKTVPKDLQASTPVSLRATAGLRLLPGDKADKILEAVTAYLQTLPFSLGKGAVSILGGQDEGGFAWLTLNYLLGRLGKGVDDTVAAIDLGGGSVQEAFAVTEAEAKAAPPGYVIQLKACNQAYNVYVHSYLGYGLMAGRAKVINQTAVETGHPCFAAGPTNSYVYAGKSYTFKAGTQSQYSACAELGYLALNAQLPCGVVQQDLCSYNGAWRGQKPVKPRTYYVSSYFWDRALEAGIITDQNSMQWQATPKDIGKKAEDVCSMDVTKLSLTFPSVHTDQLPFFCLDLVYGHILLTKGFGLADSSRFTLVKQIEYNGKSIEAAWPLGAALNDMSS